jgi:hypothetical protein
MGTTVTIPHAATTTVKVTPETEFHIPGSSNASQNPRTETTRGDIEAAPLIPEIGRESVMRAAEVRDVTIALVAASTPEEIRALPAARCGDEAPHQYEVTVVAASCKRIREEIPCPRRGHGREALLPLEDGTVAAWIQPLE